MLATFCLRLSCGLIGSLLLLSPRQVNPRFFRTQFLTALGLTTASAASLHDRLAGWLGVALAAAMACCFLGSLLWSLEGAPGGTAGTVLAFAASAGALALASRELNAGLRPERLWLGEFSSAALLGTVTSAMLMGHSYLIAPSMSLTPLLTLLGAVFAATLVRAAVAGVDLWSWTAAHALGNLEDETVLWLPVRWALGFVGLLAVTVMAWKAARIRSTQSATGILYVAVIFGFLGELTGLLLRQITGREL